MQTLPPYMTGGKDGDWKQTWGSGGGCANYWMISGPRGQVKYSIKGDKCWATSVAVYYVKNNNGVPIGYEVKEAG